MTKRSIKILFLCVGNSARSQIAEALATKMCPDYVDCYSAGSKPAKEVNQHAVECLKNFGIDISDAVPKSWDYYKDMEFDYVISLCEEDIENCPVIMTKAPKIKWQLPDPVDFCDDPELAKKVFRETVIGIRNRLNHFIALLENKQWQRRDKDIREKELTEFHDNSLVNEFSEMYRESVNIIDATRSDMICIHKSDLGLILRDETTKEKQVDLTAAASTTLTFLLCFISSEFRDFVLSKQQWEGIIYLLATASLIWLLINLGRWFMRPKLSLVDRVFSKIDDINEHASSAN